MLGPRVPTKAVLAALVAVGVSGVSSGEAHAASARVPADYFGVNFHGVLTLNDGVRDRHLNRIDRSGISQVRSVLPWRMIQPRPPTQSNPGYSFAKSDELVAALARHNLNLQLNVSQAPDWASAISNFNRSSCYAFDAISLAPWGGNAEVFAAMVGALARRYGRDGVFWRLHPSLPYRPIAVYEIWNEQHIRSTWCPRPEPEVYADYFVQSARAIRAVDPDAEVIVGGLGMLGANRNPPGYLQPGDYLRRAVARRPRLPDLAAGVAMHIYPGITSENQLKRVAEVRDALRSGGIPNRIPILLNEIGWNIRGKGAFTEPERVTAYHNLTRDLSRTNCNISGVLQHAWRTKEVGRSKFDWVGIARPASAELYPSGQEYVDGKALMRGRRAAEPPAATHRVCEGMGLPDQDGDGTPDEDDPAPLDPTKTGGDQPGGKCGRRLTDLTAKILDSSGAERRAYTRRHRRVEKRCVPCKRRIARISRKLRRAEPADRGELRARRAQIRRRCKGGKR